MPATFEQAQEESRHELVLTERWTGSHALDYKPAQALFWHHPARFKECAAGRRSGKTEITKRDAVLQLAILGSDGNPQQIGIGAPTYTRVRDIFFEDIRALIPKHWIKSVRESLGSMEFKTHWDASIRLVGLANPKIVEGTPWHKFYCDETPDTPPGWIKTNLRPALATKGINGSAWFIGVPDEAGSNQTEYEELWERGLRWPETEHCAFWWPASDILSPEEFEAIAADMDELTFRQEMLGLFIRSGNKAIPNFQPSYHVDKHYAEYSPFLPIGHSFDFGVQPSVSLVGQHYLNQIWICDEIAVDDGSTDVVCREFLARAGAEGWSLQNGVEVYGDASGRTPGQNIGKSDYQIIREEYSGRFPLAFKNLIHNPEIKDTVNAVRRKMMDRFGRVNLFIHPRCKRLIEELKTAPWPDNLREFHALAALRYFIYSLSSYGSAAAGVTAYGKADVTQNQRISAKYTRSA
jgi:hypothetical protein